MQQFKRITAIVCIITAAILFTLASAPSNSLPVYTQTAYADENSNSESNSDSEGNNSEGSQEEQASDTDENPNQADVQALINKANDGSLTKDEENKLDRLEKQRIVKQQGGEYTAGEAAQADNNLWTLYSRILMESGKAKDDEKDKNKDENSYDPRKMVKNAIGEFMGDGGVEINIPFNEMYSIGVDLSEQDDDSDQGTQAGRQLASFFSTFSHYGYIETVSGNKLAAKADGTINTITRYIAGIFCLGAILIYSFFNAILGWLVSFIGKLDIFSLLGYNDPEQLQENASNPFVKGIYGFAQGLGLSPAVFNSIMLAGFYVIVALFVFRMMRTLSSDAFHFGQMSDHTRRFIVRFLTFFAVPTIIITLVSGFAAQLDNLQKSNKFNPSPAQQYIINDRQWAAALNLSPSALQSQGAAPNGGSDTKHIDAEYAPSNSRDLISRINYESYSRMSNIKDESSMKMSLDLLFGYMQNEKFNVNTYMADIRQTPQNGGKYTDLYSAYQNLNDLGDKVNYKNYKDYIWTSKPVSSKNEDEAKPTADKFDAQAKAGVDNNSSFSTQSVALMLQTSFGDHAANFYAYNIAPTGAQGKAKNMSTVKTEWRSYTMPGEGMLGKSGSYLAMITQAFFQSLIILGCIHALLFTNFAKGLYLAAKHWFLGLSTGNPAHMLVCFVLGMTAPLSGFIAYLVPALFVSFINLLASGVNGVIRAFGVLNIDGIVDLGKSIVFIFAGFYLIIAKTHTGTNWITTLISLPTDIGLNLAKQAQRIMRSREQIRHAMRIANRTAKDTGSNAINNAMQGMNRGTAGATWQAITTPSDWASHSKNYITNQTTGNQDTENKMSAREFAAMQGTGGAKTGRSGTARSTLLGAENPNPPVYNPYGGNNYFVGTPATLAGTGANGQKAQPQDQQNHARNNRFKQTANTLPSAMKSGSANEFAKNAALEDKEKARKAGEQQAKDDVQNYSRQERLHNDKADHHYATPPTGSSKASGTSANEFASQQPPFSNHELKSLNRATDEADFQEKLYYTNNGQYAALSQDSAKIELQGTDFINRDGDIDYNKVDEFNNNINGKHLEELSDLRMRQKEQLDYAFRQGANDIYKQYENLDVNYDKKD